MSSKLYCVAGFGLLIYCFQILGCDNRTNAPAQKNDAHKTIIVQPLNGFDQATVADIVAQLKKVFDRVKAQESFDLPKSALNQTGRRYRADSIISILRRQTHGHCTTLGLIQQDISTTKGVHSDWGVMGLGYRPGNACVASTYRLNKRNKAEQLFKVAIHELGHTAGLPHCPDTTCYMRDAEGGNHTDEEKDFCNNCKQKLIEQGWRIAQ